MTDKDLTWRERAEKARVKVEQLTNKVAVAQAKLDTIAEHEAMMFGKGRTVSGIVACENNHDALDAALAEALAEKQPHCGHPVACIEADDEGTAFCAWCESLAEARREGAEAAVAVIDGYLQVLSRQGAEVMRVALQGLIEHIRALPLEEVDDV